MISFTCDCSNDIKYHQFSVLNDLTLKTVRTLSPQLQLPVEINSYHLEHPQLR